MFLDKHFLLVFVLSVKAFVLCAGEPLFDEGLSVSWWLLVKDKSSGEYSLFSSQASPENVVLCYATWLTTLRFLDDLFSEAQLAPVPVSRPLPRNDVLAGSIKALQKKLDRANADLYQWRMCVQRSKQVDQSTVKKNERAMLTRIDKLEAVMMILRQKQSTQNSTEN